MFAALKRFRGTDGKRVVYLPGNHDAEAFWNPQIQETLRDRGLVDEFAYYYLATMEVDGERRVIYCEHGNQLDPANTVDDYHDPLDTPLGHHVVMDFTRRVAPYGEVSRGLDLAEIKMVYPLMAIPSWVASRYFYSFVGKVIGYLLLPLLAAYLVYRVAAFFVVRSSGSGGFLGGSSDLLRVHHIFVEMTGFGVIVVLIFAIFFLVIRHNVRRTVATVGTGGTPHYSPAQVSENRIREILLGKARFPMNPSLDPTTVDVFVSGHTHLPSLNEVERPDGSRAVMVNSGCFLRQLQPIAPRVKGPPIFVSQFVLTFVRVFARGAHVRAELWEQPKPAQQRLTRLEKILSRGRQPPQPPEGSEAQVRASADV